MKIIEGLSTKDKQAIMYWTNSKRTDFLQQWASDALPYPITVEALNALPHCFRIEAGDNFIGIIQKIRVEDNNVHIGRFAISPPLTGKGLGTKAMRLLISMFFEEEYVSSISLDVFGDNPVTKGLYTKPGFEVVATIEGERKKCKMVRDTPTYEK